MQQVLGDIDLTFFTSNVAVGGEGGYPFMIISDVAANVKYIRFYRSTVMQAIECLKQDDSSISTGYIKTDPTPVTFTFDADEKLTRILLYSSKSRFVGIHLKTSKQGDLECYAYNYVPMPEDEVEIPVGTGFWQGIFGRSGSEIDCFGLALRTSTLTDTSPFFRKY